MKLLTARMLVLSVQCCNALVDWEAVNKGFEEWFDPMRPYVFIWESKRPKWYSDIHGLWDGEANFFPWDEYWHYPNQLFLWSDMYNPTLPPYHINGSGATIPDPFITPDYRVPEEWFKAHKTWYEEGVYFRISNVYVNSWDYDIPTDHVLLLGCTCVTVYKKFVPLGMGGVISYKHIITTASSTDVVLRRYKHKKTLNDILGLWQDSDYKDHKMTNHQYYNTPARIIYHPLWAPPERTNRSHPLPCIYDLALWTCTQLMHFENSINGLVTIATGLWKHWGLVSKICDRWTNYWHSWSPPIPLGELNILVMNQAIINVGRKPFPWFKYAMKLWMGKLSPCPKAEWDWMFCLENSGPNMRLGTDMATALHIVPPHYNSWLSYRWPGLAGFNSFSMRLRSKHFVNYFTMIDRHSVLDWLFDAIKCLTDYEYMDARFYQQPWSGVWVKKQGWLYYTRYASIKPWDWYLAWGWYKKGGVWMYYRPLWN